MAQILSLVVDAVHDVLDRRHRGQHRVILVVVFVHAVAAHQEEILEAVDVTANHVEAVVAAKISGIGLGHADHVRIFDILRLRDADPRNLIDGESLHLVVGQLP